MTPACRGQGFAARQTLIEQPRSGRPLPPRWCPATMWWISCRTAWRSGGAGATESSVTASPGSQPGPQQATFTRFGQCATKTGKFRIF